MFETSSSSLSRKLTVERKDNVMGHRFFYYIKDSEFDKDQNVQDVRKEFDKFADMLGVRTQDRVTLTTKEFGEQISFSPATQAKF